MKKVANISIFLFILSFSGVIVRFLIENLTGFRNEVIFIIIYRLMDYMLDVPLVCYFIKNNKQKKYFVENNKLNMKSFINYFALMLFISTITNILFFVFKLEIGNGINKILFHPSTLYITVIFNFFSAIIRAPVLEEIIFRGVIMNDLRGYGYKSAILINSILFGLSHTGIKKIIIMTLLGMIFSYIAYRYSLKYSILLHMVWNLCFGLGNDIQNLNEIIISIIGTFIIILSIILFIVFIIGMVKRKYSVLFSIFKFDIDDKNNMILFFKNNTVFILIILIIFFINCCSWYL